MTWSRFDTNALCETYHCPESQLRNRDCEFANASLQVRPCKDSTTRAMLHSAWCMVRGAWCITSTRWMMHHCDSLQCRVAFWGHVDRQTPSCITDANQMCRSGRGHECGGQRYTLVRGTTRPGQGALPAYEIDGSHTIAGTRLCRSLHAVINESPRPNSSIQASSTRRVDLQGSYQFGRSQRVALVFNVCEAPKRRTFGRKSYLPTTHVMGSRHDAS